MTTLNLTKPNRSIHLFITVILATFLLSCGKSKTVPEPDEPVDEKIKVTAIEVSDVTLLLDEEYKVNYKIEPINASEKEVEVISEDASIVSVNGEKLKALKLGTTNIIIKSKSSNVSAKFNVRVMPIGANKIILNKGELKLSIGQAETLVAYFLPSNVTDKTIVWTSSDPSVATVDKKGKIEALRLGSTEITASSADGKVEATARITVAESVDFATGGV